MSTDKNTAEVAPYTDALRVPGPLDYRDVRKNTQLVKKALQELMIDGVDYGTVPGCGDKKGLFKPGAEKLMLMFKLGCFLEQKNESDNPDIIKYIVKTKIVHLPTGIELGIGVGSASTDEEKYKWRKMVCQEEFDATPEERRREKWYKAYQEKPAYSVKQVRTNPADVENTVLKMAAKRSKVDAVITCTGASDIFNQGEDDIIIDIEEARQPLKKPQSKEEAAKTGKPQETPAKAESTAQKQVPKPEMAVPAGYRSMQAKYNGLCPGCNNETKVGAVIFYKEATKKAYHPDCV